LPRGGCGAAGCGGGACIGAWEVLAVGTRRRGAGVLVRGGIRAGCFPLDMGGVGSELACIIGGAVPGSVLIFGTEELGARLLVRLEICWSL